MIARLCVYGFGKAVASAFAGSKPTQKDKGVARRYQARHLVSVEILDRDTEDLDDLEEGERDEDIPMKPVRVLQEP